MRENEQRRDVYLEPTADLRTRLGIDGSVYGLRHAQRAWYRRVRTDLEALGWRVHQLDQCVFLKYEGDELIGVCGVYLDDFIIAGKVNDPRWKAAKGKLVGLYKWGKLQTSSFTLCGVRYLQTNDYSVVLDQQEFTRNIDKAEFHLPKSVHKLKGKTKLSAAGLETLRGINGSLQWLVTNTRIDLAAKVSLSASETSNPTIASLQKANKIIRQAQRHSELPIHIHAIPLDKLNFGVFSDAAWGVRPDGSSQGGYLVYASSHDIHGCKEAPVGIMDWKSWKLSRNAEAAFQPNLRQWQML